MDVIRPMQSQPGPAGGALEQLAWECAARVAALADALRSIPAEYRPVPRATTVAIREQIYYGWEKPLARARGMVLLDGKYEVDGWWSVEAARLVNSGSYAPRTRRLEREHVNSAGALANDILNTPRTVEQIAALLDERVVTCTVLAEEHRRLPAGEGWQRYREAGIKVQRGLE